MGPMRARLLPPHFGEGRELCPLAQHERLILRSRQIARVVLE
jgi:hypothetical protein